jgi:hypothetical protein
MFVGVARSLKWSTLKVIYFLNFAIATAKKGFTTLRPMFKKI